MLDSASASDTGDFAMAVTTNKNPAAEPCAPRLPRRRFLQGAAVSLLGAPAVLAQPPIPDVMIIGAGLAGLTAARELSQQGYSTLILEARERLGGRAYPSELGGQPVELGGSVVHPAQRHIQAEIRRYGLTQQPVPWAGSVISLPGSDPLASPAVSRLSEALAGLSLYCAEARALYPEPYNSLQITNNPLDAISVSERLASLTISPGVRDDLAALLANLFQVPLDQVSAAEPLRLFALAGYSAVGLLSVLSGNQLAGGSQALIDPLFRDGRSEVHFGRIVSELRQRGGAVTATLVGGEEVSARLAIITIPHNALGYIKFNPDLSQEKRRAIAREHAGHGVKIYVRIAGNSGAVQFMAPQSHAIQRVVSQSHDELGSVLILFGSDTTRLDPRQPELVARELASVMPGVEVLEQKYWHWAIDPFSRGAWCAFQSGRSRSTMEAMANPERGLLFANADWAPGWQGFMDGAIASGLRAARQAVDILARV